MADVKRNTYTHPLSINSTVLHVFPLFIIIYLFFISVSRTDFQFTRSRFVAPRLVFRLRNLTFDENRGKLIFFCLNWVRMKGSFYGLSTKQLTLFLAAVALTTILLVGWAKTPIVSSLIPSQGGVLKLLPVLTDKEVKAKEASRGVNGSEGASPSVSIVVPVYAPNTIPATATTQKENLTAVDENIQETTTKHNEVSPKQTQDSVAPLSSVTANSSLIVKEDVKTPSNQGCSYAIGKWILDDSRPLYSGFGCKQWLSSMWACRLTQRTDFEYEKLRWQPKNCEMENFTGSKFLRRMQNKTIAFIGDSLGRQQFQSLMCMVTEGEERPDVLNVGWEYGLVKEKGHVRPDGWAYRFPSTNTTILYYWSASLCDLEPLNISNPFTDYAMHLDRPPSFLQRFLHRFDVLVLNTGHHWNRGKLEANRWIMHVGGKPNTNTNIADIAGAKNFTIYSIVKWVNSELPKYPGLKAFYRSISPRHFFNGDWNTGGTCDNTTPRSGELQLLQDESIDPIAAGSVKGTRVKLLDITAISQLRDEGHISRYNIKATPGMQDCLHWCLPGVPDTWNELLFAQI